MYRIRAKTEGGFVSSLRSAVRSPYYSNDGVNSGNNHYGRHALDSSKTYFSHVEKNIINIQKQQSDIRNLFDELPGTIES